MPIGYGVGRDLARRRSRVIKRSTLATLLAELDADVAEAGTSASVVRINTADRFCLPGSAG